MTIEKKPSPLIIRRYGLQALSLGLPRVLSIGAQLFFLPLVLHSLTLREYGLFASAAMVGNFIALASFPQLTYGAKVAIARGQNGQFFFSLRARGLASLPLLILSVLIILFLARYLPDELPLLLVFSIFGTLIPTILAQTVTSFWVAKEKFLVSSGAELTRAILVNGIGAVVAVKTNDLVLFAMARLAADVTFSILATIWTTLHSHLWSAFRSGDIDRALSSFGIRMFWANLAVVARTEGMSAIVVGALGVEAVGIFRVAYSNIYSRLQGQLSNFTDILYARNARQASSGGEPRRLREYGALFAVGIGISAIAFILSAVYIRLSLPPEYHRATIFCAILICALPLDVVYSYVNQLLLVRYDVRSVTILLYTHLSLQLALVAVLGWRYGLVGVCASVPIAVGVALALGAALVKRGGGRSAS